MTHFTDRELERWRDAGPGGDKARLHAHLRECGACAARYAEAIRTAPLDEADAADTDDFVAAGYRAAAPDGAQIVDLPARRWRRAALSLAAAAVLVAAIAVPWLMRQPAESTPEPRPRGADVQLLSPAGSVSGDVEFTWSSGLSAARFRVDVGSGNLTIYSTETDRSPLPMPAALRQLAKFGEDYWWTVTALDPSGSPIVTSARQPFTIVPARR